MSPPSEKDSLGRRRMSFKEVMGRKEGSRVSPRVSFNTQGEERKDEAE